MKCWNIYTAFVLGVCLSVLSASNTSPICHHPSSFFPLAHGQYESLMQDKRVAKVIYFLSTPYTFLLTLGWCHATSRHYTRRRRHSVWSGKNRVIIFSKTKKRCFLPPCARAKGFPRGYFLRGGRIVRRDERPAWYKKHQPVFTSLFRNYNRRQSSANCKCSRFCRSSCWRICKPYMALERRLTTVFCSAGLVLVSPSACTLACISSCLRLQYTCSHPQPAYGTGMKNFYGIVCAVEAPPLCRRGNGSVVVPYYMCSSRLVHHNVPFCKWRDDIM